LAERLGIQWKKGGGSCFLVFFHYSNLKGADWTWFAFLFSLLIHWVKPEFIEMGA
jgi:hypothetical protein